MTAEPTTSVRRRGAWALGLGLAIGVLYTGLRLLIDHVVPFGPDGTSFYPRDALMNAPRLLGLALAVVVGVRLYSRRGLGLHADRGLLGLVLGGASVAVWLAGNLTRTVPFDLPGGGLLLLTASAVVVACFEEVLFRGVLLCALRDLWDDRRAVWASAALFALFHLQTQPLGAWFSVFLYGAFLAILRSQGVGLLWLILAHAAVDSLVFLGSHGPPAVDWLPRAVEGLQVLLVIGVYLWAQRRVTPGAPGQSHPPGNSATT